MQRPSYRLLVPSLVLLAAVPARAEVVERIVAKVNGDIITLSEFQMRQVQEAQAARVEPDNLQSFLRDNNARILNEAIDDLLLYQRAEDTGLKLPPSAVNQMIEDIKKEHKIASEEEFQTQLAREGMTLDELKRNMERSVLRQQVLRRDLESKVMVTDAEVRAEYEARKDRFSQAATVSLREILLKGDDDATAGQALALVERARAGEDFAALARASSAASTRASGGDLGKLSRGDMNADLEKVAFALPAGSVSDPIRSGDGWRILKVEEKSEASVTPYDTVKDNIRRVLTDQKMGKEMDGYLVGLREKATIDVKVREVPQPIGVPVTPGTLRDAVPPGGEEGKAPAAGAPAGAPASENDEIVTTPQARPEQINPGETKKPNSQAP